MYVSRNDEPTTAHASAASSCGCSTQASPPSPAPAAEDARLHERLAQIDHKVVVLSGKGGVGKSTVAVNVAVALASQGFTVGLLDIDLHGPSVPLMLGLEDAQPANHEGALVPLEFATNLKVMSIGFLLPSRSEPVIWRGPLKHSLIKQFLSDVEWGQLDYLIVDAPPGTGDEPLSVIQLLGNLDGALLVTTPQEVALSDVRKCVRFCGEVNCPVLGIIENMSGLVCPHCGETIDVFRRGGGASLARQMGVPFLGEIPLDPALVRAADAGKPYMTAYANSATAQAFRQAIEPLLAQAKQGGSQG
jgi:Mrp family chromosome partitioning ATPase